MGEQVLVLCVCMQPTLAEYSFCIHPVFLAVRTEHKQIQKAQIHIRLKMFPNESVMLE